MTLSSLCSLFYFLKIKIEIIIIICNILLWLFFLTNFWVILLIVTFIAVFLWLGWIIFIIYINLLILWSFSTLNLIWILYELILIWLSIDLLITNVLNINFFTFTTKGLFAWLNLIHLSYRSSPFIIQWLILNIKDIIIKNNWIFKIF